jgi:hypothetical protein
MTTGVAGMTDARRMTAGVPGMTEARHMTTHLRA